jgi:hypothetical protein
MTDRYVYLYRITLSKECEDPLYYFGIRFGFEGCPEDDDYMGSPQTYKDFWDNPEYTKTKEILKVERVTSREDIEKLADEETLLIKESWNTYGLYSKGGRCLNMAAGRLYLQTPEVRKEVARKCSEYWTGNPLHPMKRPEVAAKQAKSMSKFLLENPERNPNNLPHVKEKQRERGLKDNPMHRPEIAAKVKGEKNPMYGKKHSDEMKRQISESTKKATNTPEYKKKQSEISKKRWEDPAYKQRLSDSQKRRWQKIKQQKITNSLENYFD